MLHTPALAGRQRRQQPRHSLTCTLTWRPSNTAEARVPPEEGCGHMHVFFRCRGQHLGMHLRKAAWRSELPLENRARTASPCPGNYSDHARGTATWRRPRQTPPAVVGDSARSSGTRFVATSRIWQVQVSQSTLRNTIRIGRAPSRAPGRLGNPSGRPYGAIGPPGTRWGIFCGFGQKSQHLISDCVSFMRKKVRARGRAGRK